MLGQTVSASQTHSVLHDVGMSTLLSGLQRHQEGGLGARNPPSGQWLLYGPSAALPVSTASPGGNPGGGVALAVTLRHTQLKGGFLTSEGALAWPAHVGLESIHLYTDCERSLEAPLDVWGER